MKSKKQYPEKAPVIAILKGGDRATSKFNQLLQLLMRHPEHPPAVVRHYNAAGFSKERLQTLEYDVKKTYGITSKDLAAASKVVKITDSKKSAAPSKKKGFSEALQTLFDNEVGDMDYHKVLKPTAVALAEQRGDELKDMKGDTLKEYLSAVKAERVTIDMDAAKDAVVNAPEIVKGGWKIHDEYDFLDKEDCPEKLKVLVSDMVTAHRKYLESRGELKKLSEGDTAKLDELTAAAVKNFELNKEIKAELDYYKEHGEILGNHPIFADEMLLKKVAGYKEAELGQKRANLRSYISKEKKKLEIAKDDKSKAVIQEKIDEFEAELKLIEKRLGDAKE